MIKFRYTKQRSGHYHLNIPIPAPILHEYAGKVAFERSTETKDPKEAEQQVAAQRVTFDIQARAAQRKAGQASLKTLLDPADVATVESLAGAANLAKAVEDLRKQMAFLIAGQGATGFPGDEDLPPDVMRNVQIKAEMAANQASQNTITSEIRRLKSIHLASRRARWIRPASAGKPDTIRPSTSITGRNLTRITTFLDVSSNFITQAPR